MYEYDAAIPSYYLTVQYWSNMDRVNNTRASHIKNTGGKITGYLSHVWEREYSVRFNAANLSGGIYFYRFQPDSFVKTNKMLFIK